MVELFDWEAFAKGVDYEDVIVFDVILVDVLEMEFKDCDSVILSLVVGIDLGL